jgi:ABC-2 type transport system permease protein
MGIYLLIYDAVPSILDNVFSSSGITNAGAILICTMLCLVATMNDMTAPSVSLEGKNLWLPQSLPIDPKLILYAKASVQLILSGIPMLIAVICAVTVVDAAGSVRFLIILTAVMYVIFSAFFNILLGIKMPVLTWTSEIAPIKQSGGVFIAMFGGWGVCALMGGLYLFIGYKMGAAVYLLIWTLLFAAASIIISCWLNKRGSVIFSEL